LVAPLFTRINSQRTTGAPHVNFVFVFHGPRRFITNDYRRTESQRASVPAMVAVSSATDRVVTVFRTAGSHVGPVCAMLVTDNSARCARLMSDRPAAASRPGEGYGGRDKADREQGRRRVNFHRERPVRVRDLFKNEIVTRKKKFDYRSPRVVQNRPAEMFS
jgi:hypothetical protein